MSDCGGDCGGGDSGGDYGGDDVQTTTFDSDYPAETTYFESDSAEKTTYFDSDYPAETTYFESDSPEKTTYFDSNAPADESSHDDENSRISETVEIKHVDESYSYYRGSNNWHNGNVYPPRRSYISSNSSDDCGCGTCMKIFLVASTMFIVLIVFIFIMKKN